MIYPELSDTEYVQKLLTHKKYQDLKMPPLSPITSDADFEKMSKQYCEGYEKFLYQYILQQHLSSQSPYHGLLLFHGLGFGKTCSAITFAEEWINQYTGMKDQEIWVITSSALIDNFKSQLFRKDSIKDSSRRKQQCTSETYYYLWKMSGKKTMDEFDKIMESRYRFYTYDKFGTTVLEQQEKGTLAEWAKNRILIIDEAHNLRNPTIRGSIGLTAFVKQGTNNRLVLMTATPMFDQPDEILQLLSYLVENDKRSDIPSLEGVSLYTKSGLNKKLLPIFKQLCANYISYVKGKNPFTLAVRLSPEKSGIPVLHKAPLYGYFDKESSTQVSSKWLEYLEDGLVVSELQEPQAKAIDEYIYAKKSVKNIVLQREKYIMDDQTRTIPINTNLVEATNIVYPSKGKKAYQIGMDGFQSVFKDITFTSDEGKKKISYIQYDYYGEPYLYPSENYLKQYSTKMYDIMKYVQQASGIVLIFSHYIWSGVIPMAVALEHLGYRRYKDKNFLKNPDKYQPSSSSSYTYVNPISSRAGSVSGGGGGYTIFCSDNAISGVDTFQELLDVINSDANKNGEQIKVVLMSPVASEGISFKNIREMHILDPWYHFNRLEQVIGRSIRTCSHQTLPVENRNVTVFLHTSAYPINHKNRERETYDTYVYHLASDKKEKTEEIEKIIRDHALDCQLQENINYYSPSLFPFTLKQLSSQNVQIYHSIGDNSKNKPICHGQGQGRVPKKVRYSAWRKEVYAPLTTIAKERIRKLLWSGIQKEQYRWNTETLLQAIAMPYEIGLLALKELQVEGFTVSETGHEYQLLSHALETWVRLTPTMNVPVKIDVQSFTHAKKDAKKGLEISCEETLLSLLRYPYEGIYHPVTMVTFLTLLNLECWKDMAKYIIVYNVQNVLTEALWREGWLLRKADIVTEKDRDKEEYTREQLNTFIGYTDIDLMETPTDMKLQLWSSQRDGTWAEQALPASKWKDVQNKRIARLPPTLTSGGMYGFYAIVTDKKNVRSLKFKIMMDTQSKREKTGIVSTSLTSIQLRELLDKLAKMYRDKFNKDIPIQPNFAGKAGKENESNRTYLSSWVAYYMGLLDMLYIPPFNKPKV